MAIGTIPNPILNKGPFFGAMVRYGCSQEEAEAAAEIVVQAAGMKRPPGFPVTTQIVVRAAPCEVKADVKNDNVLVLVSISRIQTS